MHVGSAEMSAAKHAGSIIYFKFLLHAIYFRPCFFFFRPCFLKNEKMKPQNLIKENSEINYLLERMLSQ